MYPRTAYRTSLRARMTVLAGLRLAQGVSTYQKQIIFCGSDTDDVLRSTTDCDRARRALWSTLDWGCQKSRWRLMIGRCQIQPTQSRLTLTRRRLMAIVPEPLPHLRFEITEAAHIRRISRATLYERIRVGLIATQKDGRRTFITATELQRYVAPARETVR